MNKYQILKRYIELFFNNHSLMTKEEAELIIQALECEPEREEEHE